jgi:hypothetical protein
LWFAISVVVLNSHHVTTYVVSIVVVIINVIKVVEHVFDHMLPVLFEMHPIIIIIIMMMMGCISNKTGNI